MLMRGRAPEGIRSEERLLVMVHNRERLLVMVHDREGVEWLM